MWWQFIIVLNLSVLRFYVFPTDNLHEILNQQLTLLSKLFNIMLLAVWQINNAFIKYLIQHFFTKLINTSGSYTWSDHSSVTRACQVYLFLIFFFDNSALLNIFLFNTNFLSWYNFMICCTWTFVFQQRYLHLLYLFFRWKTIIAAGVKWDPKNVLRDILY